MPKKVIKNLRLFLGRYELSGRANALAPDYTRHWPVTTTLGGAVTDREPGVLDLKASVAGFWDDSGDVDAALYTSVALTGVPFTHTPPDAATFGPATFWLAARAAYTPDMKHGEPYGFQASIEGKGGFPCVFGTLMEGGTANRTVSGNSGQQLLGAVPAGWRLYAALHVLDASGTSPQLNVVVESSAVAGFTPNATRLAFTAATGRTEEFRSASVAAADTYWRVSWTLAGTSPSFRFVVAIGFAPA